MALLMEARANWQAEDQGLTAFASGRNRPFGLRADALVLNCWRNLSNPGSQALHH